MTSIILTVVGAKAKASVNGPLTSGMVGIPVTIEYDDAWNGLTKNLVCRCGQWGPESGETRTVLNIGETASVAHEVMKADRCLYLGVEGYSADGMLVMPTTWAYCGTILPGANAGSDPSESPKLSAWNQLQAEIKKLKQRSVTKEQIAGALDGLIKACAFVKDDVSAEYAAFRAAFGITDSGGEEEPDGPVTPTVTLSSISATYSGGDVPAGTAVTDLTGLVVTAYYSDGSQQNVTGYTLSGTIAEGSNTVTVTYQGKTATFTVTGVVEPTKDWTSGTAYELTGKIITNTEISSSGAESAKEGWNSTDYLNCYGADYIYNAVRSYISFYDVNKTFIKRVDCNLTTAVPDGAVYIRVSTFNAQYWLVTEESVVMPITKATDFTAGEQTVTWVSGDLSTTTGEIVTASSKMTTEEMIPIGGATTLTLGDSLQISKIAYYDADKNYITCEQSKNTPYTLLKAYSFARVSVYTSDTGTITLA